jgi:phosphoribosylamine--glycine ligase
VVDAFREASLPVCGPTQVAARIESSKVWAKEFMTRHGIPTARFAVVETEAQAEAHLAQLSDARVAVKADGLAAGKGVIMAGGRQDALASVKSMLEGQFGMAGARVVLEETLVGVEVSVFAFVDGETVSNEVAACDYKRIGDGDVGPNTGGMGAYTPPEFWTPELAQRIREEVLIPTARGMASEGVPFTGILFAGLMVTNDGPKVIEFNCRLGDPDGALVLPRLKSDLLEVCLAIAEGRLSETDVFWDDTYHVSVVMASGGYPGGYETGKTIYGIDRAAPGVLIFHAGTAFGSDGEIVTSGGRVLAALSSGRTFSEAREGAYAAVAKIEFEGAIYRSDIAARAESDKHVTQ